MGGHSDAFCRFYLRAAACVGGATLWLKEDIIEDAISPGAMLCYHPHGVIPLGFSFNGGLREKAKRPEDYLPAGIKVSANSMGVEAPVLFRIPFLSTVLKLWGACLPAEKSIMRRKLFDKFVPFGILPGGIEEIAIHEHGKENVYIKTRVGFIKYGLEYGYKIIVVYTFGESDQYHSITILQSMNLWLIKSFGFALPAFWGRAFNPLLPKGGGLHSVVGEAIQLPKIANPSKEDVAKWHGVYVDALVRLFDRYKGDFGYGSRKLQIF